MLTRHRRGRHLSLSCAIKELSFLFYLCVYTCKDLIYIHAVVNGPSIVLVKPSPSIYSRCLSRYHIQKLHFRQLSARSQPSPSKQFGLLGTLRWLICLSFCEEDFVVTGYAGEFINAISSVAYGNTWASYSYHLRY